MKIIDEHTFEGKGYHPFLITARWPVAYLNYAEAESLEQIEKLDIHHQTDEVFILLQGKAALIGASVTDQNINYDVVNMQPGIVYNIRREVWHKIAMQPGSQVLIIENNDTHLNDFEFFELTESQKSQLRECVTKIVSLTEN